MDLLREATQLGAGTVVTRQNYREPIRPDDEAQTPSRRTANKRWAELIYRIYDVDPLTCDQCGGVMKILTFITDPSVTRIAPGAGGKAPAGCDVIDETGTRLRGPEEDQGLRLKAHGLDRLRPVRGRSARFRAKLPT